MDNDKPVALTIAGFDPSNGAGASADLEVFSSNGNFGCAVLTTVTFQNSTGVSGYFALPEDVIERQFSELLSDYDIRAAKIGMLGGTAGARVVKNIALQLKENNIPIVLDPVYSSSKDNPLYEGDWDNDIASIISLSSLITPNVSELARLTGDSVVTSNEDARDAAIRYYNEIHVPILVTGGHIPSENAVSDFLICDEGEFEFRGQAYGREVHGTGCLISAAITAYLARGFGLPEAIGKAEEYVDAALHNPLRPGKGQFVANRLV